MHGAPPVCQTTRMQKRCAGVYRITSPSGGFYIGSSVCVASRWSGHRGALRNGRHHCQPLQRAAAKYGVEALRFELLAKFPPEDLRELEQLVLDMTDPEYNASRSTHEALTDLWKQPEFREAGKQRAREQSARWRADPEWQARQRESVRAGIGSALQDPAYRERHCKMATKRLEELVNTPAGKAKAAEARRQRYAADPGFRAAVSAKIAAALCRPVVCLETGQTFPSARAAAQSMGFTGNGGVGLAIKHPGRRYGGYTWAWAGVDKSEQGT